MSSIIRATTTSGLQVAPDNSGSLQLQTNGTTTAVTIDTSQNVGIGTASPSYKLDVRSASGAYEVIYASNSGVGFGCHARFVGGAGGSTDFGAAADAASTAIIRTNSVERMRIDSSGNVLVGTTAAPSSSVAGVKICSPLVAYSAFSAGNNNGEYYQIGFLNGNGLIGRISTNGSATSYVTSSDYRLKNTIEPMTGALDKVAALKPCTYKWNADDSNGEGFIAHELAEVCPQAVSGDKDAVDSEGNPEYQGIDTSFLVATLTAAIQEQQTIINDLKARIETLEAK